MLGVMQQPIPYPVRESCLAPNIGLEMETSDVISNVLWSNPNPLRRGLLVKTSKDDI